MNENRQFLDEDFEFSLIKCIIGDIGPDNTRDIRYGNSIINYLSSDYFSSKYTKIIVDTIIAYHKIYKKIPSYKEIDFQVNSDNKTSDIDKNQINQILLKISKYKGEYDSKFVKNEATKFFQQQAILAFAYGVIDDVMHGKGDGFDVFLNNARNLKRKLFQEEKPFEITETNYDYLDQEDGYYVPLGWGDDLDQMINFRQGSMLMTLAPTGVGKTTAAAVTAVKNFLDGRKVLVIFFEDDYADVYKKIMARLSGIKINDLKNNKQAVISLTEDKIKKAREKGNLTILKKSALHTKTNDLEDIIDNYIAEHGRLDLVILDYIDCVKSSSGKTYKDQYMEEYDVVMEVLDMISDLNYFIPLLTFTQTGRGAINKIFIDESDTGGTYGKMKKAPQIVSIGKTPDDKVNGTGNISILKNRKGDAGYTFKGGTYDNARVIIHFTKQHIETSTKTLK